MVSPWNRLGMLHVTLSHHSDKKLAQHRTHNPLPRPEDTLNARRVVCHRRRPLSRRGALAPGRRLPPDPSRRERERAGDRLWHAPRREPGLRRLGRQPSRRPGDAHQQPGGPHPDRSRQVFGLPPRLGRGPHHGLGLMGKLPW